MKRFILTCLVPMAVSAQSAPPLDDSLFEKTVHVGINWVELGMAYSVAQDGPGGTAYGEQHFFSGNNSGIHHGYLGVTLYYKRFGLGCMYNFYSFRSTSDSYTNYLIERYSDYYVPSAPKNYTYTLDKMMFSLSYRIPFRWFFLEPKFRLGLHSFRSQDYWFEMKKKGSNDYVKLGIDETIRSSGTSYHFGIGILHQFGRLGSFGNFEAGIQGEFLVTPVTSTFTFTESSYEVPETHYTFEYQRWNPAFGWNAVLSMYF